jgi:hypothetical protein
VAEIHRRHQLNPRPLDDEAVPVTTADDVGKGGRWERPVIDDVRQVPVDDDDEYSAAWERLTDDPDVHGIESARLDEAGGWQVTVSVMEFVREEPLKSELRRRIAAALQSVEGAETILAEDREVWFVAGTPAGDALMRAAAEVADEFADRTRSYAGS